MQMKLVLGCSTDQIVVELHFRCKYFYNTGSI